MYLFLAWVWSCLPAPQLAKPMSQILLFMMTVFHFQEPISMIIQYKLSTCNLNYSASDKAEFLFLSLTTLKKWAILGGRGASYDLPTKLFRFFGQHLKYYTSFHGLSIFPECGKGEKRTWNAGNSLCNKAVHSPSAHTAFVKTCSCLLLAAGEARTSNY